MRPNCQPFINKEKHETIRKNKTHKEHENIRMYTFLNLKIATQLSRISVEMFRVGG
jgi:hypothetical protein